jgi:hypothetical protein
MGAPYPLSRLVTSRGGAIYHPAMRARVRVAVLAALLAALPPTGAAAEDRLEIRLTVGSAAILRLGFVAVRIVCDDLTIVRVEDGHDHLRLVGRAPGRTQCGFWRNGKSPKPARVYDVVVTPAPR